MGASAIPAAVRRSLRETFGLEHLRVGQHEVICRVLAGQDTLAIMPTGAGKSLCYQLPALHLKGTTLVVSPLIALMKDQVERLEDAGVAAEQLNSAQPKRAQSASLDRIADARSEIVFATPERLGDAEFIDALRQLKVALLVVDEAHCISQWGHDFRPAFLEIGAVLPVIGDPTVLALTATATPDVVHDIRRQLRRPQMQVVHTGVFRPNLRLQVVQCVREDEKFARLLEALRKAVGSGIVYCSTVKACDELYERLAAAGESVACYHGRLPTAERHANQDRFMNGELRVMVATNAFGMGIDKADIRFVLHWQLPGTPEAYYQEAGRAGRDGEPADCVLLYLRRDTQVQQFFLAKRYPSGDDLVQVFDTLRRAGDGLSLAELDERLPGLSRNRIAVALALLRQGGLAAADRSHVWRAKPGRSGDRRLLSALAADYEEKAERDREALERMVFYAQTGFCRWRVLLQYFDEALPFAGERCGRCDNCLRAVPAVLAAVVPQPRVSWVARFQPGDAVRVPRYGSGRVVAAAADEVTVLFPDRKKRTFVAAVVQSQP
jgi:ATP-dependent DNA helicase RecQ